MERGERGRIRERERRERGGVMGGRETAGERGGGCMLVNRGFRTANHASTSASQNVTRKRPEEGPPCFPLGLCTA